MHKIKSGSEQYTYEEKNILGKGTFSSVYRGLDLKGQNVAIKLMDKSKLIKNYGPDIINYIMQEGEIMCKLDQMNSPYIVKIFSCIKAQNYIIFVTQLCDGTILQFFNKNPSISTVQKLKYFYQILLGMRLIHKQGISHRDIKCDNIYIKSGIAKIGDFGFATANVGRTMLGSPAFMAPQIILNRPYNSKADIWSLGVTLYEMLLDKLPYSFYSIDDAKEFFSKQKLQIKDSALSKQIIELVNFILQTDPSKRPSVDELLALPIFQGFAQPSSQVIDVVEQIFNRALFLRETGEQITSGGSFLLKLVLLKKSAFSLYELSEIQKSECLKDWRKEWCSDQSQQKMKLKGDITSELKHSVRVFQTEHAKLRKSVSQQTSNQQFWMDTVQLINNDFKKNIANKLLVELIEISLKTDPTLPADMLKRILTWTPLN